MSCNVEYLDTTKIKNEIEAHKIKKVSESEVLVALNDRGKSVETLFLKLDCTKRNAQLDSLSAIEGVEVEKVFPATYVALNDKEKEVIEALAYSAEQNETFNATPQKLSETEYAYYFSSDNTQCSDSTASDHFFWRVLFQKEILVNSIR
ncbi:hypothetical protein DJ013_16165 [Arcticibacterium luteifluviistationis]|uniref:Uncharacterized protein n=1 Tax=Arcticibacterium luteifluviistationis TaxID=1784714 RepID=A0A2Z4GFR3_9BACT|nr:hypothetical protein DJ013_16165 [Arcticibacterium luteifluviistationis]